MGRDITFFYDNLFSSSISFAKDLLDNKVYSIGTTRVNRENWPNCLKVLKELQKSMSSTSDGWTCRMLGVERQQICTIYIHHMSTLTRRNCSRRAKDGNRQPVNCPHSVELYNQFMGGVDFSDACRKNYTCSRRLRR